ncbi:MAG: hypothetical protein M3Y37_02970 [Chloroflexota bacterium]|nr:hypothetical protein [Chloroflexota bacterium]
MPSLDYLRSGAADEIDPRSDFCPPDPFARAVCQLRPGPPLIDIDRLPREDLRQEAVLRVLEERSARHLPPIATCLGLVAEEREAMIQALGAARTDYFQQRRRIRSLHQVGANIPARPGVRQRASLQYLDVSQVVRRMLHERRPGVTPRVLRQVVVTMIEADTLEDLDGDQRARLLARLRRLRRQTGLTLDVQML